jgi:branched-subunit amino acid ABC-type transport system permease component
VCLAPAFLKKDREHSMVFLQNLINALQWGSFYALIALGYSMVYSILMLFNFAHGDIFMVGSYIGFGVASALIALTATGAFALPNWLILVLTIIFSMFLTSFVGMIVERVGYRPLRDAPRASAAITGLMIGIILETGNLALLGQFSVDDRHSDLRSGRRIRYQQKDYDRGGVPVAGNGPASVHPPYPVRNGDACHGI